MDELHVRLNILRLTALKTENPPRKEAPRLYMYEDPPESLRHRLPTGKKTSQRLWMFKVKEEQNSSENVHGSIRGFDMSEFNKPKWQLPLVFEMKDRYSEKHVLSYVLIVGVTTAEVLIFVEDSWNKEPCRDVHQVGDEREVEVMRLFKWPPSELMAHPDI
ncbi:hypothetical protein Tco_1089007 [Tanacetum coccineum]